MSQDYTLFSLHICGIKFLNISVKFTKHINNFIIIYRLKINDLKEILKDNQKKKTHFSNCQIPKFSKEKEVNKPCKIFWRSN